MGAHGRPLRYARLANGRLVREIPRGLSRNAALAPEFAQCEARFFGGADAFVPEIAL